MAKKNQHVVPKDGSWAVRKGGASKATKVFPTQSDAVKFARDLAVKHRGELYIHSKDGTVRERRTYGNDPGHPKDEK